MENAELAFIRWIGSLQDPAPALRAYARQYQYFSLHQIRAFAQIMNRLPATDRGALSLVASVLYDELGQGKESEVHSVMFERFASSIGVPSSELPLSENDVASGVRNYISELFDAFGQNASLARALATYLFLERSAVLTYQPFLDTLRLMRLPRVDSQFFEVHATMEIGHERAAADLVARYASSDSSVSEIASQTARMARCWQAFWADMLAHCQAASGGSIVA